MRALGISTGKSRLSHAVKRRKVSWDTLRDRLLREHRTRETLAEYLAMSREQQARIKDVGFFVGGVFGGTQRRQDELRERHLVTLDIDHLPPYDLDLIEERYAGLEYVVHSTHKHSPDYPRLRIVFPLSRPVKPFDYEPLARKLAERLGMDYFDDTTFQPARVMFWGSTARDGEWFTLHGEGAWADPDQVLGEYADPQDFASWPVSSREGQLHQRVMIAADPLQAPGVVGAFNRVFDIHQAIAEFELPYEPTGHDNRYLPVGSTGAAGAVVYDDVFLYSHHESDPAGLKNCNAFDLVRIHRFGDWTREELDEGVPVTRRDSFKQMAALAMDHDRVVAELGQGEFDDDAEDAGESAPQAPQERTQGASPGLTYDALLREIEGLDNPDNARMERCITRIAAAKLGATEVDILASVLRRNWPDPAPQKGAILKQIKTQGLRLAGADGGDDTDIELAILQGFLDFSYNGGEYIRRWARGFWCYRHGVWQPDEDEHVKAEMIAYLRWLREQRPEEHLQLVAAVGDAKTSSLVGALWNLFCAIVSGLDPTPDPLGLQDLVKPAVANFQDGEVWVTDQGQLERHPHKAEHNLTTQLTVPYSPRRGTECYLEFMLDKVFSLKRDPHGYLEFLEALSGYILQSDRSFKIWILGYGTGYNGKSAWGNMLSTILGEASIEKRLSDYGEGVNNHAEAGLVNKLLLIDDDYSRGVSLPDGFLKRASEAKRMTANPKFQNEFRFVSRAVPVILANYWPGTRDTSLAIRERAMVLNFDYYIAPEQRVDADRRHILQNELPGVAARWLQAYARARAKGCFPETEETLADRVLWVQMSNPVTMFVQEQLEVDPNGYLPCAELWSLYRDWSRYSNPGGGLLKKAAFFERMDELLGARVRRKGGNGYSGWALRPGTGDFD